MVMRRATASV